MAEPHALDADRQALVRALADGEVEYVLLGGAAIEFYGGSYRTVDLDVLPKPTTANLQRLADVLNKLECRLAVDPGDPATDVPLPAQHFTAAMLARQQMWNLRTRHGELDVLAAPAGFPGGYDELAPRATQRRVAQTSIEVRVAALEDVEHSKRTAGRQKDLDYLHSVNRVEAPRK